MDNAAELSAADRALLIQPPGLASAKELLRIAVDSQHQSTGAMPAGAGPSDNPSDASALDLGSIAGEAALALLLACYC